jgi:hypothetical protein
MTGTGASLGSGAEALARLDASRPPADVPPKAMGEVLGRLRARSGLRKAKLAVARTRWCLLIIWFGDAVLDLSWVHNELTPYYSHTGRPSIDSVLMIRMLIVGYVSTRMCAIASERWARRKSRR